MAPENNTPHYARNLIAFTGDTVAFIVATSFIDTTTVLPAFASLLTSSAPLIGLISTMQSGGWLFPQLIAANYVANKPYKKPYILRPLLIGRPVYLLLAAITLLWARSHPALTLMALYLATAIFYTADGLASVPWFDVLGKAIPGRRRGRYLALAQVSAGILSIGAGLAVRRLLDPQSGLAFPRNYSALFAIAFGFYTLSTFFLLLIKEPVETTHTERTAWRQYLPMLVETLRRDHVFRRVIIGRLLAGLAGMAVPFFILFGTEALRLSQAIVGVSLTAQVVGRVLGGLLLGLGVEKLGHRLTLLGGLTLTSLAPALALLISLAHTALSPAWVMYLFPAIFFFIGVSMNTVMWGFTNYVLDIAPPQERATYVGLANTLTGLLIIAPPLGGAILQLTSFPVLFALAFGIYLLALLTARKLPPVVGAQAATDA